jgi:hypothetical protein
MPYIKISDPNIIDLSAWHQVINVVNQHSDSLTAITNNFGTNGTGTLDWTGNYYANEFNSGNQKIIYGRTFASIVSGRATNYDSATTTYYGQVLFADSTSGTSGFKSIPIITATGYTGNVTGSTPSNVNNDIVITIYNVTVDGFYYRVFRTGTTKTITGDIHINWIAIGPRA